MFLRKPMKFMILKVKYIVFVLLAIVLISKSVEIWKTYKPLLYQMIKIIIVINYDLIIV